MILNFFANANLKKVTLLKRDDRLGFRNKDLRILGFRGFLFRKRILGLSPLGRHNHSDGGVSPSKKERYNHSL